MPGTIDLIVPYAGPAALLRETVLSVLAQTEPGWRLVVVEDGPQDATVGPWLHQLDDDRVVYHRNPERLGVAGNFQRCLDLAEADHLVLLGCDDRLLPDYVAAVTRGLQEHPEVDLVQPGVTVIDGSGHEVHPLGDQVKERLRPASATPVVLSGEPLLRSLMVGNWAYFPSLCWKRVTAQRYGFRADLQTALDLALLARIVLDGGSMLLLSDSVFCYRRHAASASSLAAVRSDRFEEERQVTWEIAQAAAARGWLGAARAARLRPTSRLHAVLQLPRAARTRDGVAARGLLRHALLS